MLIASIFALVVLGVLLLAILPALADRRLRHLRGEDFDAD